MDISQHRSNHDWIEVITGGMCSGKSAGGASIRISAGNVAVSRSTALEWVQGLRMEQLSRLLFVLGVGFLIANLRLLFQFIRFLQIRSSALLTWPGRKPPMYGMLLFLGAVLAVIILCKLTVLRQHPQDVFGESMMLVYYGYALPLSLKIGRGFYADGIWADSGFVPYSHIGGLTWREGEQLTLVLMYRMRNLARRLVVPESYYGAARRLLRDKIAAHDIHFTGKSLDLGLHDERDDV